MPPVINPRQDDYIIPSVEDLEDAPADPYLHLVRPAQAAPKPASIKGLVQEVLERTRVDVLAHPHPELGVMEPKPGAFVIWVLPALVNDPKRLKRIQDTGTSQDAVEQEEAFVDFLTRCVVAWNFSDPINETSMRELGAGLMGLMVKAIFRKEEDVKESGSPSING